MEIIKIGEVYSDQIKDLSYMHEVLFINSKIHAEGDMIMIRLKSKYETKYRKSFNEFTVFEIEELKKEFRKEIEDVYSKYEDRVKVI